MRVGVIGPANPDLFADNIVHCLPDLGVEAVPLGPPLPVRHGKAGAARTAVERLLGDKVPSGRHLTVADRAIAAEVDVVICIQGNLHPESVQRMRAAGIAVALWFPDHVANYSDEMLSAPYTRLYVKDRSAVAQLRDLYGLPAGYLPEACNPAWHRPVGDAASVPAVAAVGNLYPTRVGVLDRLVTDGVPLNLHSGNGFPRWMPTSPAHALSVGPPVFRLDKARVFRQAGAVLNNLHPAEIESVNCRLFEATACGGAVLCEDRADLAVMFDIGSEVLAFRDYEELLTQARELLADPDRAREIGDAASVRAHAEHTYQHRLPTILAECA